MTARRSILLAVGAIVTSLMVGCSDSGGGGTTEERPEGPPYAVLRDGDWQLREAVDPPADDPTTLVERPPLAWYAEYIQELPMASRLVRLSGHERTFAESRADLERGGFQLADVDIADRKAVGGHGADGSPALILFEQENGAVILLSPEVDLEELVAIANKVEAVDRAAWVDAGGIVRQAAI